MYPSLLQGMLVVCRGPIFHNTGPGDSHPLSVAFLIFETQIFQQLQHFSMLLLSCKPFLSPHFFVFSDFSKVGATRAISALFIVETEKQRDS